MRQHNVEVGREMWMPRVVRNVLANDVVRYGRVVTVNEYKYINSYIVRNYAVAYIFGRILIQFVNKLSYI